MSGSFAPPSGATASAIPPLRYETPGIFTAVIPSNATSMRIIAISSGGGGGSARRGASGTTRWGGGGGTGGNVTDQSWHVASLNLTDTTSRTMTITVPAGGAGGTARTGDDLNGGIGEAGNPATVTIPGRTLIYAGQQNPSSRGNGGTNSDGWGGGANSPAGQGCTFAGSQGANSSVTGNAGNSSNAASAPGGGGGGGGIDASDVGYSGGFGGSGFRQLGVNVLSGGAPGLTGTNAPGYGGGGAGGNGNASGAGGTGGDGAFPGGGGGGGGASLNGFNSGAGGKGGDGAVYIYFF